MHVEILSEFPIDLQTFSNLALVIYVLKSKMVPGKRGLTKCNSAFLNNFDPILSYQTLARILSPFADYTFN